MMICITWLNPEFHIHDKIHSYSAHNINFVALLVPGALNVYHIYIHALKG